MIRKSGQIIVLASGALLLSTSAFGRHKARPEKPGEGGRRISSELKGSVATREGLRLKLVTELGNVQIHTHDSPQVDYRVRLETDTSEPDAQKMLKNFTVASRAVSDGVMLRGQTAGKGCTGRLWVTFAVTVPKNYSLDVSTDGGNIETDDINGRVSLTTAGGNITSGTIDGTAHLETGGGHITVKDVTGELIASTGGGHITTGAIAGSAVLHTGGGHIRVTSTGGSAKLETGGGNVSLERAGSELVAETGGGQIQVGEASGNVRARTGGGGIHVIRVAGPTNLETGAGSIYLTRVDGKIRASTGAGEITAWFGPDAKLPGGCDLESSEGDIVVYLPRLLPVTIDAQVELGQEHRVFVDPAFPLKVSYDDRSNGGRVVRAAGMLNGGGEVLRLRAVAGNIRLMLSDTSKQLELYRQQMEQLRKQLRTHLVKAEPAGEASPDNGKPQE